MDSRLIVLAFVLVACGRDKSNADEAQEAFTTEFSCPKERVTVTARTDLKAYDLMAPASPPPPAEVAADPGRLAEWNKGQHASDEYYNRVRIMQVRGCDRVPEDGT